MRLKVAVFLFRKGGYMAKVVVRDGFYCAEDHPGVSFHDESLTDQSQADDCDVNRIVDRFHKTGVLPGVDVQRMYGDFSSVFDFQQALDTVHHAQAQFDALDAKVRKRFDNDPAKFLEFVSHPKNAQEMVDLGLASLSASPTPGSAAAAPSRASNAKPAKPAKSVSEESDE